jgi:hypothetical protein
VAIIYQALVVQGRVASINSSYIVWFDLEIRLIEGTDPFECPQSLKI